MPTPPANKATSANLQNVRVPMNHLYHEET